MDVYYVRESALPQDQIARLIGARTPDEMAALDSVLSEFFELISGSWIQHRCEKEIETFSDKSIKAKRSASARWDAKESNTERNADAMPTHNERNADGVLPARVPITNNQTPITNKKNTSAIAPPDGVLESVWADFVELRKSKKAKLTQTAIDGIEREAHRAGWSLENALRECCSRGWTGFKADWVSDKPRQSETFAERDARNARKRWEEMTGQVHPDNLPKAFEVFDSNLMLEVSP